MRAKTWKIDVVDGLRVHAPDGRIVTFATRKCGAVVAMLALRNGAPVSRFEMASALWPSAPHARQNASLRKALQQVRRAFGDDGPIRIERESCWLDTQKCQVENWTGRTPVLPEMPEMWFEEYRPLRGSARNDEEESVQAAAVTGLLEVLEWTARMRPRDGLAIARRVPELVESASPKRVLPILDACLLGVPRNDRRYGWGLALKGMSLGMSGRVAAAVDLLKGPMEYALLHRDSALYVFSVFYRAAFLATSGRNAEALEEMRRATAIRFQTIADPTKMRLRHGLALALFHSGRLAEGLKELRAASAVPGDRLVD